MERFPWILGFWMVAAPFVFNYSDVTPAFWNDLLVGLAVLYFSYRIGLPFPKFFRRETPYGTK